LWGGHIFILPFVEQANLLQTINPDGCTLPPATTMYNGKPLLQQTLPVFVCPSDNGPDINPFHGNYAKSNYPVNERIGDVNSRIRLRDMIDGTSNTLMHAERRLRVDPQAQRHTGAIMWGRSNITDAAWKFRVNWPINTTNPTTSGTSASAGDGGCKRHGISSAHTGGAQVLLGDGSVRFLSESIATNPALQSTASCIGMNPNQAGPGFVLQNLFFPDDGQPVGDF
jgi:prepilin-type processing-associated H-X9-DG protein